MRCFRVNLCLKTIERLSLRRVLLAFTLSFLLLTFLSFITITRETDSHFYNKVYRGIRRLSHGWKSRIVIIVSNRRSGSSFLGELFNQNPQSFYLFEPLLPYTTNCEFLKEERIETLSRLFQCNFDDISRRYRKTFDITRYTDRAGNCLNHTLCFVTNQHRLLEEYATLCRAQLGLPETSKFDQDSKYCSYPLQTDILHTMCKASSIVAFKVVRVCSLDSLESLYREFTEKGHRVSVIHLVRDPRAIFASMMKANLDGANKANIEIIAGQLCGRMRKNIQYVETEKNTLWQGKSSSSKILSDGRYMKIRFEDLALNTIGVAKEVYRFVGEDFPPEIESWIRSKQFNNAQVWKAVKQYKELALQDKALQVLNEQQNPYSMVRDPREVVRGWRWSLSYDLAMNIQNICSDVIRKLGYRDLNKKFDLINSSIEFFNV